MSKKRKPNKPHGRSPGPRSRGAGGPSKPAPRKSRDHNELWLWGHHAVIAALGNPKRRCLRLVASDGVLQREEEALLEALDHGGQAVSLEKRPAKELESLLPEGAVHQGLALLTQPLAQPSLHECVKALPAGRQVIVALDQVTDPHNVGAIIRSAAVFGAAAVLSTDRNAPAEGGLLAKTASGGFDLIPYIQETNLARALEFLKNEGFWCLGLASEATETIASAKLPERLALVMGAEGAGLRRLTREHCDLLLAIEAPGAMADLNVSNATAVCLYEFLARPTP